eukprot:COSAG06_NODE_1232_length_10153_cov_24.843246_11_plen_104_part_00
MRKPKAWPKVRSYTSRVTCAEALARSPHCRLALRNLPGRGARSRSHGGRSCRSCPGACAARGGGTLPAPAPPWHLPAACLLVRGWHSSADKSEAWFGKSLLVP